jgi:hypothetical protein
MPKGAILHSDRSERTVCALRSFGEKRKPRSQRLENINTSFRAWPLKVSRSTLLPKPFVPDKSIGTHETVRFDTRIEVNERFAHCGLLVKNANQGPNSRKTSTPHFVFGH